MILEIWELGYICSDRWMIFKLYTQKIISEPQMGIECDQWWAKVQVQYICVS